MGKPVAYTSSWHDGDMLGISAASTLEQTGLAVPRVNQTAADCGILHRTRKKCNIYAGFLLSFLLLPNVEIMGKDVIRTSLWHDGDTIEISAATTLEQTGPTVPRVNLIVGASVDFSGESFTFADGSTVDVRPGGELEISEGQTVTVGQNSELRLRRHSVGGQGRLVGDFAQIDAPMAEVFAPTVNVGGRWLNDRVYPQWFGAVAYPSLEAVVESDAVCSARAIEKAAEMAVGGEVFIPKGYYAVRQVVCIPTGVKLRGASSLNFADVWHRDCFGTVLVATNFATAGKEVYMLRVNTSAKDKWDRPYPRMCGEISHLAMLNNDDSALGAIYAADSAHLDNVVFQEFRQAVKYADRYIDNKSVTNCTFYLNSDKGRDYAFDFGHLGDAFLFEHNAIHTGTFNNGIKINGCGGGSVNANIINADCLISDSKGVDFTANHIEEGHILEIHNSVVTTRGNYFWLGQAPSVQVYGSEYADQSVVSMDGDVFTFYDSAYYGVKSYIAKPKLSVISEIRIDKNVNLNLSNCYRYWFGTVFGKVYKTGIYITDETGKMLEAFNEFSYKLSQQCQISPNYRLAFGFSSNCLEKDVPKIIAMTNEGVYWHGDAGKYRYYYQVIIDKCRQIGWPSNDMQALPVYESGDIVTINKQSEVCIVDNKKVVIDTAFGILFNLQSSFEGILRLVRESVESGKCQFVDIPVCGTPFLYDNGISVNGYPWASYGDSDKLTNLIEVNRIDYQGANARIFTPKRINGHSLMRGDVVFNTGDDSSWNLDIFK